MDLTRPLTVGVVALAIGIAISAGGSQAQSGETAITCTNPVSGATWQIKIDYDQHTVDSNPAHFSETEIAWRGEKDRWNYKLDRKSGNLTIVLASSTGGNFLYDHCKLEN
jgi:hypothetical protein